ncbi:MAG: hypothetical protein IPL78_29590 [Chloroflexi bacterium]|nr:hypothetical protein [Chloroflexota bacterium]
MSSNQFVDSEQLAAGQCLLTLTLHPLVTSPVTLSPCHLVRLADRALGYNFGLMAEMPKGPARGGLGLVLLGYLLITMGYGVVKPLFEAPDENWHYFTVQYIADTVAVACGRGRL